MQERCLKTKQLIGKIKDDLEKGKEQADEIKEIEKTAAMPEEIKDYSDIPLFQATSIFLDEPVFDGIKIITTNPTLKTKMLFRIYRFKLGYGNRSLFIFARPEDSLISGNTELVLKPIPDYSHILELYADNDPSILPSDRVLEKNKDKNREPMPFDSFFALNNDAFFELGEPIRVEILNKIVQTFGLEQLIDDFLFMNGTIDDRLKYSLRNQLITFGNKLNPAIQKFNDNLFLITNTKTGKTTIMNKICGFNKFDSGTSSNLIGFSTADRIVEGSINGQFRPIGLDDINTTNYQQEFMDGLPSILEQGRAIIGKGRRKIITECSASFIFSTNSENISDSKDDLMIEFSTTIDKISSTPQRVGSRFACVLFGDDFRTAETTEFKLTKDDIKTNEIVLKAISKYLSDFAGKLVDQKKIEKFLETTNNDFKKTIIEMLEAAKPLSEIRDFWAALCDGYRHMNGMALKESIIDYFSDNKNELASLIKGNFKITEEIINQILVLAKEHLIQIQNLNIGSLRQMLGVTESEKSYIKARLEALPVYLKVLVEATAKFFVENPKEENKLIVIEQIEEYLPEGDGLYKFVSQITQKITNIEKANHKIRIFGIELLKQKEGLFLRTLKDFDRLKAYILENFCLYNPVNSVKTGKAGKDSYRDLPKITENENSENKQNDQKKPLESENKDSLNGITEITQHKQKLKKCDGCHKEFDTLMKKTKIDAMTKRVAVFNLCKECLLGKVVEA